MLLNVNGFISYADCPRKYLHQLLNSDKAAYQPWADKKREIVKTATIPNYVPQVEENKLTGVRVNAGILASSIKGLELRKETWEADWGRHKITHEGWCSKDGIPVHIHISSSPFRDYARLYLILMLLKKTKFIVYKQTEPRIRMRKDENSASFGKRLQDSIVITSEEVTITPQEIVANTFWIIKTMNKIQRGDFNVFNSSSCARIVEVCPFYNLCWAGKAQIMGVEDAW